MFEISHDVQCRTLFNCSDLATEIGWKSKVLSEQVVLLHHLPTFPGAHCCLKPGWEASLQQYLLCVVCDY